MDMARLTQILQTHRCSGYLGLLVGGIAKIRADRAPNTSKAKQSYGGSTCVSSTITKT